MRLNVMLWLGRTAVLVVASLCLAPAIAQWTRVDTNCVRETGEVIESGYASRSWATAVCRTLNRVESLIGASIPEAQAQLILTNPGVNTTDGDAGGESGGGSSSTLAENLTDDFDDNSTDTATWDVTAVDFDANVTVSETSSQLQCTPRTSFVGQAYSGYLSDDLYDLTGSSFKVEVVQATSNFGDTELMAVVDEDNYLAIVKDGNSLYFKTRISGSNASESVPYDSDDHQWWRIRHDDTDDTVKWETSADGVNWTTGRNIGEPFAISAVKLGVRCGTSVSEATPGQAKFDNFNVDVDPDVTSPPTPTDLSCAAASSTVINCSWTASVDAQGETGEAVSGTSHYNVRRDSTVVATPSTSSLSDTGLTASTQYCYTVDAEDNAGNTSTESTQDCATTDAAGGGGDFTFESGFSGSWNGTTLTFTKSGGGFGTKQVASKPILYMPFGDGLETSDTRSRQSGWQPTMGEVVASGGTVTEDYSGDGLSGGSDDDDEPTVVYPGSSHVFRRWFGSTSESYDSSLFVPSQNFDVDADGATGGGTSTRQYFVMFYRIRHTWTSRAGLADHNWKDSDVNSNGSPASRFWQHHDGWLNVIPEVPGTNFRSFQEWNTDNSGFSSRTYNGQPQNEWYERLVIVDFGSAGPASITTSNIAEGDGWAKEYARGGVNSWIPDAWFWTSDGELHRDVIIWEYVRGQLEDDYTFVDMFYLDNSPHLVLITDKTTWSESDTGLIQPQPITSWSDTTITIDEVDGGPYGTVTDECVYVLTGSSTQYKVGCFSS